MSLRVKVARLLSGALVADVTRHDHSWRFDFTSVELQVEHNWRLSRDGRLVVTDRDDGMQYGLPRPVDAEAVAQRYLRGQRVTDVQVSAETADLMILTDGGLRLEVLTTSRGHEAWQLDGPDSIIAAMDGRLSEARGLDSAVVVGGPWE